MISETDFKIIKKIGKGSKCSLRMAFYPTNITNLPSAGGSVFLVRKTTGLDNGRLYAMKVQTKATQPGSQAVDHLNEERRVSV